MAKKFLDLNGFKYFISKIIGKTSIAGIGDGTITSALNVLQRGLQNSPNLINKGTFKGNFNSVGVTGGLPEGNSVVWIEAANCTGTLPDARVSYFQLITISNNNIFQIAIIYDQNTRAPRLSFRYYINNAWTPWGGANKQYYYSLDQLGFTYDVADVTTILPAIPKGATLETWLSTGKLRDSFIKNIPGLTANDYFYLKIDHMGDTWKLWVYPYNKSDCFYMNTYTTTNNIGWDTNWYKFGGERLW